ncbi:heme exporter protein CcmD [Thalassotalea agarivorans]|uniref:Heme exporter protein D n=1 Tax=Thalassotalea agarivorans TaxID=349064 RepID=A0A1H9Y0N5_THASX|nr:heme exporter protein CcmD [Thalassotalea agarivorans]SES62326.1 heme exporter protein D [Thalassotalea agarivorans]
MQFDTFSQFINMDGHGFYVWLSYGFSWLLIAVIAVMSKKSLTDKKQEIAKRIARQDRLKAAQKQQSS